MRRNRNDLDHTGQLAKKDGERKTLQHELTQCRRASDWEAVWCLANILERGGDFGKIACAKAWLLYFVVGNLLEMLGLGLRKEQYPHLSKACALRYTSSAGTN